VVCVVKGLEFPWVQFPPGVWSYQPEAALSVGGGNETVESLG